MINENGQVLAPTGSLCTPLVADIRLAILSSLTGWEKVVLDISGVEEFDTAGIQLLLSISRMSGNRVCINGISDALIAQMERLGLGSDSIGASAQEEGTACG